MLGDGRTVPGTPSPLTTKTTVPMLACTRLEDRRQGYRRAGLDVLDLLLLALSVSLGHGINISGSHPNVNLISKNLGVTEPLSRCPEPGR